MSLRLSCFSFCCCIVSITLNETHLHVVTDAQLPARLCPQCMAAAMPTMAVFRLVHGVRDLGPVSIWRPSSWHLGPLGCLGCPAPLRPLCKRHALASVTISPLYLISQRQFCVCGGVDLHVWTSNLVVPSTDSYQEQEAHRPKGWKPKDQMSVASAPLSVVAPLLFVCR